MKLKNLKLFDSIRKKTNEIIANTENTITEMDKEAVGDKTVSIMMNGTKIELNQDDYNRLKEQNYNSKLKLKEDIKNITKEYKENLKNDLIKNSKSK